MASQFYNFRMVQNGSQHVGWFKNPGTRLMKLWRGEKANNS